MFSLLNPKLIILTIVLAFGVLLISIEFAAQLMVYSTVSKIVLPTLTITERSVGKYCPIANSLVTPSAI